MKYTDLVHPTSRYNEGLSNAKQATLINLFGKPSSHCGTDCGEITNHELSKQMITTNIGNFRCTGHIKAIEDLRLIFDSIKKDSKKLHDSISTAGMLCVRLVRGSKIGTLSSHSFGTAIDLKLDGQLDARGDDAVQYGLTLIAPHFNAHGWYWGYGFSTEDSMHFEVSDNKLKTWFTGDSAKNEETIQYGDRGKDVIKVQSMLKKLGYHLAVDGQFGNRTKEAVTAFQKSNKLATDGVVGAKTLSKLNQITSLKTS